MERVSDKMIEELMKKWLKEQMAISPIWKGGEIN